MRRMALLCVLVTAAVAIPIARPRAAAATWSYGSSDHFDVYFEGKEKDARSAAAAFEGFHTFFERILTVQAGWRQKARLVIFANAKEYSLYQPRTNVEAYWLGTPDGDFIALQSFDPSIWTDAIHEFTHLMIEIGRAHV